MEIWYDGGSFSWVPPYCSLIKKGGGGGSVKIFRSVLWNVFYLVSFRETVLLDGFQALFPTGIVLLNHIN